MPFYLQRVRLTVHTKNEFLAGTNSPVKFCYLIEEKHVHPKLAPGVHTADLDHPWHDDFQSGKSDSYEVVLGSGKLGKSFMGQPILNGLQFEKLDDAKTLKFHLRIEGRDQWIFDRLALGGYFMQVRPVAGSTEEFEEVEVGWLALAKHKGDVSMSADPNEGEQEFPIAINALFEP